MGSSEPRLVGVRTLGVRDLSDWASQATPLVEQAFGGDRAPGWLALKLRREVAQAHWSSVALTGTDARPKWADAIGFMWVGGPGSLPGTARALGMGVLPAYRRRGVARRLVEHTLDLLAGEDVERLRCLVEPDLEPFYASLGFEPVGHRLTLVAQGQGPTPIQADRARAWSDLGELGARCEWLEEAWEGTPTTHRFTLDLERSGARAWVSLERGGWLVQRLATPAATTSAIVATLSELLRRLPAGETAFLYGVPEPFVRAHGLVGSGRVAPWSVAQRFVLMERFTTRPSP